MWCGWVFVLRGNEICMNRIMYDGFVCVCEKRLGRKGCDLCVKRGVVLGGDVQNGIK